jgi:hypothetical protein
LHAWDDRRKVNAGQLCFSTYRWAGTCWKRALPSWGGNRSKTEKGAKKVVSVLLPLRQPSVFPGYLGKVLMVEVLQKNQKIF